MKKLLFKDNYPVFLAEGYQERKRGLIGISPRALLLSPCPLVHMIGMEFTIDLVFIRGGRVVKVFREVGPGFRFRGALASSCLELPAGDARKLDICEGDQVAFQPAT